MSAEINLGKQIVDFIGPEGSGKSYQAKNLANLSGKPYISVGDILRHLRDNDPGELGDRCRDMFNNHAYLDAPTLLLIQEKYFKERLDTKEGFVLDGGLRTVEETLGFPDVLKKAGIQAPVVVIHLRVPSWMGAERLIKEDGGRKREDDTLNGVLSRLSHYYENLAQRSTAIQSLEGFTLIHIDATKSREEVTEKIVKSLKI